MTRVLSYNIQSGGTHRTDKLATIIGATGADIIGLTEATDPQVAEELAQKLGMHFYVSEQAKHNKDWHVVLLSRLPVKDMQAHVRPDILTRQHLLEVTVEENNGSLLTVFVAHLTANFYKGSVSNRIRQTELQEILRVMAATQGTPHLLMGDFNAVAPGESIKTSALLSYFLNPTQAYPKQSANSAAQAELDLAIRSSIRALEALPGNTFLSAITDSASVLYAPSASLELLDEAGYVDCYRRINPRSPGLTYPSPIPAGRIDFIFASPELAHRLSTSYVVVKAAGVAGDEASDHLPVFAEYVL
jgi:endonuclease/exonuclease/phosphatase family metal-dependent hydrolase